MGAMVLRAELGVVAAGIAPAVGALGLTLWDASWKGGAFSLNLFKCCLASTCFVAVAVVATGGPLPLCARLVAQWQSTSWLVLSAMLGIVIGDCCWLAAMQQLGARRLILLSALKPFVAAAFGALCLHELLPWRALAALALTMLGVVAAALPSTPAPPAPTTEPRVVDVDVEVELDVELTGVMGSDELHQDTVAADTADTAVERAALLAEPSSSAPVRHRHRQAGEARGWNSALGVGLVLALLDLVLDVYGAVLTRQHGAAFTSPEINAIRFGSAAVVLLATAAAVHLRAALGRTAAPQWASTPHMTRAAWVAMVIGVGLTTFTAPTMSTWALFRVPSFAVWNGLGALGPMWAVPLAWCLKQEPPKLRTAGGAALAAAGAALLGFVR